MTVELKNKPLVEAIFELRWKLHGSPSGPMTDQHYKLLLARFYDRVKEEYPDHEQLPHANLPDELVGYQMQHRFRESKGRWPLVQIGPGIFSLNSTSDYAWDNFKKSAIEGAKNLIESHPNIEELNLSNAVLRYINAVEFDYNDNSIIEFLRDKLKIGIDIPPNLFNNNSIRKHANKFVFLSSFECGTPEGNVTIRFSTGQKHNKPAIVWETVVETKGSQTPSKTSDFGAWLDSAHSITHDWFFKMIDGELEESFK